MHNKSLCLYCTALLVGLSLSGCGKELSEDKLKKMTVAPASSASEVVAVETLAPTSLTVAAPASATVMDTITTATEAKSKVIHEFNPADFPDACNDYVDTVSQCIDVMDKAGLEGTASMQMQLDEMQASWLKEPDKKNLNGICTDALSKIDSALRDLGC